MKQTDSGEYCIVFIQHNTVFARIGPLYATGVSLGPPESWTQTVSRLLPNFLQGSLGERPTEKYLGIGRPKKHKYDIRKHKVDIDMGWCYLFIVEVVKYSWSQTGNRIKYLLQNYEN